MHFVVVVVKSCPSRQVTSPVIGGKTIDVYIELFVAVVDIALFTTRSSISITVCASYMFIGKISTNPLTPIVTQLDHLHTDLSNKSCICIQGWIYNYTTNCMTKCHTNVPRFENFIIYFFVIFLFVWLPQCWTKVSTIIHCKFSLHIAEFFSK